LSSEAGTNLRAAEFIQYLSPPLSLGPSGKTCPRCESLDSLLTSVLLEKSQLSSYSAIFSSEIGFVKLGQPVPESNLSCELKSGVPSITST